MKADIGEGAEIALRPCEPSERTSGEAFAAIDDSGAEAPFTNDFADANGCISISAAALQVDGCPAYLADRVEELDAFSLPEGAAHGNDGRTGCSLRNDDLDVGRLSARGQQKQGEGGALDHGRFSLQKPKAVFLKGNDVVYDALAGASEELLAACRHGGMTELGDAGLTEPQIMSLSAHKTPAAARVYVKRTEVQRMTAARKRRQFVERAT